MPRWKEDDPAYYDHIKNLATKIREEVVISRAVPDTQMMEKWHDQIYRPVASNLAVVGKIRQWNRKYPALNVNVAVTNNAGVERPGVQALAVPQSMTAFSARLKKRVDEIDGEWNTLSRIEKIRNVVSLVAWAHGEFVRIHPFRDGNGRMARLLSNCLLSRFGITYTLDIRPRPTGSYGACADASMTGNHADMEAFLLREVVLNSPATS